MKEESKIKKQNFIRKLKKKGSKIFDLDLHMSKGELAEKIPISVSTIKPAIYRDGHKWYCKNLTTNETLEGIGNTPQEAMESFDAMFVEEMNRPPTFLEMERVKNYV